MFSGRRIPPENITYTKDVNLRSVYGARFVYADVGGSDYGEVTCQSATGARHTWNFHTLGKAL
jgi:hypothetical protein